MSDGAFQTVLKRKAEAGRGHSGGGPPSPEKALGQSLAKAAQDMMKLPLGVARVRVGRMSLPELIEGLPERALIALLAGPDEGLGLMALSPEMVASLIEMQTTRRIGAGPVAVRRPTRTDAAMSAPYIDRVLQEFEGQLCDDAAITWAGGFRYGSYLDDVRPLGLLMEDTSYRVFRVTLAVGEGGEREADLLLCLPADGKGPPPAAGPGAAGPAGIAEPGKEWRTRMEGAVLGACATLDVVLDRISMPLSGALGLAPGAVIPIAPGALARLRIEGRGRRLIAHGKLGQCQGRVAVRLLVESEEAEAEPAEDTFRAEPAERRPPEPAKAVEEPGGG